LFRSTSRHQQYQCPPPPSPFSLLQTIEYFDQWGDEGEVNLGEAMAELTILVASRALLGKEIRENLFK
jgi:sterol 14-demethylase